MINGCRRKYLIQDFYEKRIFENKFQGTVDCKSFMRAFLRIYQSRALNKINTKGAWNVIYLWCEKKLKKLLLNHVELCMSFSDVKVDLLTKSSQRRWRLVEENQFTLVEPLPVWFACESHTSRVSKSWEVDSDSQ